MMGLDGWVIKSWDVIIIICIIPPEPSKFGNRGKNRGRRGRERERGASDANSGD